MKKTHLDAPFEAPTEIPTVQLFSFLDSWTPIEEPTIIDLGPLKKLAIGSFATKMIWSTRRGRNVTIWNKLHVWDSARNCEERVPCAIIGARQELIHFLEAFQQAEAKQKGGLISPIMSLSVWCVLAIWQAAIHGVPTRKKDLSLPLSPPYSGFRLKLQREGLKAFTRFFTGGPPPRSKEWGEEFATCVRAFFPSVWEKFISLDSSPPWLHLIHAALDIELWLLDLQVLRLVLHPPRGKAAAVSLLTRRIEATLFIYRELVRLRDKNAEVRGALDTLLDWVRRVDQKIGAYLKRFHHSPQAIAVVLTQRWLLIIKEQKVALLGKRPRDVFQLYLYHKKGQREQYTRLIERACHENPSFHQDLIRAWIREYLTL